MSEEARPEVIRVREGEIAERFYDVLTTVECEIDGKYRLDCKLRGLVGVVAKVNDVFSIEGDISVVSGGDKSVYIKPKPQTNCKVTIYERLPREEPGGKDIKIMCGEER